MKRLNPQINIQEIKNEDYVWIRKIFKQEWGGDFIVSKGKIHRPEQLNGYIAKLNNRKVGLITYEIQKGELEIVSLNSFLQNKGIGTKLVKKVINLAKKKNLKRVWLITTNDNLKALKFWQKRGFVFKKVYSNAIELSRKIKPGIPLVGNEGIPLRDEIELEMKIKN